MASLPFGRDRGEADAARDARVPVRGDVQGIPHVVRPRRGAPPRPRLHGQRHQAPRQYGVHQGVWHVGGVCEREGAELLARAALIDHDADLGEERRDVDPLGDEHVAEAEGDEGERDGSREVGRAVLFEEIFRICDLEGETMLQIGVADGGRRERGTKSTNPETRTFSSLL